MEIHIGFANLVYNIVFDHGYDIQFPEHKVAFHGSSLKGIVSIWH
jgi:hypothetical protein